MSFRRKKMSFTALVITLALSKTEAAVDIKRISADALVSNAEVVECNLENNVDTQCAKFVVKYQPDNLHTGPFCPETLTDKGGIWQWDGEEAGLYRIDAAFLTMLNEQGYRFYDADGKVHVTDVRTTRPGNNNSCLAASLDTTVKMTILLPLSPVKADKASRLGTVAKVGLALDGVPIFADAPSVLQTGHMPALDPCGGHVDPGGWYHWHATSTDINNVFGHEHVKAECALEQKASAMFAYAFDGYAIYGSVDHNGKIPTDLDACNGHVSPTLDDPNGDYHYHASTTFPNLPSCLSGVVAKDNFSTNAKQGIGAQNGRGGPGAGPDLAQIFESAAKRLGVSLDDLLSAVKNNGGRELDVSAAAKELGVTESALKAALPRPPGR